MGLEGLRVLELGEMVSAAFASKMMADLGADVIKIEPPDGDRARRRGPFAPAAQGDPEQSGLFLALNTNKRGVELDLGEARGRARFEELVARADVLVHSHPLPQLEALGLSYETLRALRPELVMCSITPFGLTGPHARYRAEEITVQHGSGWGYLSPGASDFPEEPPLKASGHQADLQAGIAGAMAGLAAYYRAARTGQGEHVDLSSQAWVASHLEAALVYYTYPGALAHRTGARGLNPWGIYECKDGLIFVATIEEDQWQRLIDFMGRPDWALLELFEGFPNRWRNADALRIFLSEWIGEWKVDDLFHQAQKQRICFAPVLSMAELGCEPHLQERGFFVDLEHPKAGKLSYLGAPYRLREPWWRLHRPAPMLGEHDAEIAAEMERAPRPKRTASGASGAGAGLPLSGVRVADLSWVWAGPFCAMQLAHLGAEVIKIESDERPDLGRRLAVYPPDTKPGLNRSGYFNQWNQGKKSLRLNLGNPDAIAVVKRLVAECDVVVENFAVGVMERLGLDYETLQQLQPDLIMASISGYGETGPYRNYMGYGPAISPISGLSALSGYAGGPPSEVGLSLGDPCAGVTAAAAVCAALAARENGGGGQHIDCSLWESVAATVAEGWMESQLAGREPERIGNRDPLMAPHGVYPCLPGGPLGSDAEEAKDKSRSQPDDRWISIACATDAEWQALAGAIEKELESDDRFATAIARKQNEDTLDGVISDYTKTRDPWEVTRALQARGVAAFPCMSAKDIAEDTHLEARGFHERLDHPEVGRRQHAGIPWRLTNGPNGVRAPAPCLGADTEAVLIDLLGYDRAEIEKMVADGVIA